MGLAVASLSHRPATQRGLGELAGCFSHTVQLDVLINKYSAFTWKIKFLANRHTAIRHKLYPYELLCEPEYDSVSSASGQCPKVEGALKDCKKGTIHKFSCPALKHQGYLKKRTFGKFQPK